jgi:hypothetical protein
MQGGCNRGFSPLFGDTMMPVVVGALAAQVFSAGRP